MTTSLPAQTPAANDFFERVDPGCLVGAGLFKESDFIQPPRSSGIEVQSSFTQAVSRAAPVDPGCLGEDGLNVLTGIELPQAAASSARYKPARTLNLSTEAWGLGELAAAEKALNAERSAQEAKAAPTFAPALV